MHTKGRQLVTSTKALDYFGDINLGRLALWVTGLAFSCSNKPDPASHLSRMLMKVRCFSQLRSVMGIIAKPDCRWRLTLLCGIMLSCRQAQPDVGSAMPDKPGIRYAGACNGLECWALTWQWRS